jgi:hypothetical protein
MYCLTPDGIDSIEEGIECLAMLLYYGSSVGPNLWKLYPQMLYIVAGKPGDVDGGFAFEYLNSVATCIQNFVAKDPHTFLTTSTDLNKSYI